MKIKKERIKITSPQNQLSLFGYESYFDSFVKLFKLGKLPKVILLTGPKGLGKATFLYHFINFILSKNEERSYSINNREINENNLSYKLLKSRTHPNFFLLDKHSSDNEIKIENVRNLRNFLTKTSYSKDLKLVLIDNSETLNQSSLNALLKPIEEPSINTFFFIVFSTVSKLPETLKSRCFEYKIFFTNDEKRKILTNILSSNSYDVSLDYIEEKIYTDTPGNILNYILNFSGVDEKILSNHLKSIFYLMDIYNKDKNKDIFPTLIFFIEIFYNTMSRLNMNKVSIYYFNYIKILKMMHNMKKYSLDEKNILFQVADIIKNEK